MREYWQNLSAREKNLLLGLVGFIVLLLLYFVVYNPIASYMSDFRAQVAYQKQLAQWLQNSAKTIQTIPAIQNNPSTNQNLATTIATSINKFALKEYLLNLKTETNKSILLQFQNVPFDNLLRYITYLWQSEQIKTSAIEVIATKSPGIVNVALIVTQ